MQNEDRHGPGPPHMDMRRPMIVRVNHHPEAVDAQYGEHPQQIAQPKRFGKGASLRISRPVALAPQQRVETRERRAKGGMLAERVRGHNVGAATISRLVA